MPLVEKCTKMAKYRIVDMTEAAHSKTPLLKVPKPQCPPREEVRAHAHLNQSAIYISNMSNLIEQELEEEEEEGGGDGSNNSSCRDGGMIRCDELAQGLHDMQSDEPGANEEYIVADFNDDGEDVEDNRPIVIDEEGMAKFCDACVVCGDRASGRHYGAVSCEGCKGFFKRSIRKKLGYVCRSNQTCVINKYHRNRCQSCRLQKCIDMGMRSDSVQSERKPSVDWNELRGIYSVGKKLANDTSASDHPEYRDPPATTKSKESGHKKFATDILKDLSDLKCPLPAAETSWVNSDLNSFRNNVSEFCDIGKRIIDGKEKGRNCNRGETPSEESQKVSPEGTDSIDLPECLVTEETSRFVLHAVQPRPAFLNLQYICESASRLLFLSMHWSRKLPVFPLLQHESQEALMKKCWAELFSLGLSQSANVINLPDILSAIIGHLLANSKTEKTKANVSEVRKLKDYVVGMIKLKLTDFEYAYLKLIICYNEDFARDLKSGERKVIEAIQRQVGREFLAYENEQWQDSAAATDRYTNLLLRLPALRSLCPHVMEEVFFTGLIGNIQIGSVIPYLLHLEDSEYGSLLGMAQMATSRQANNDGPIASFPSSQDSSDT